jgi:hypothetical protein
VTFFIEEADQDNKRQGNACCQLRWKSENERVENYIVVGAIRNDDLIVVASDEVASFYRNIPKIVF